MKAAKLGQRGRRAARGDGAQSTQKCLGAKNPWLPSTPNLPAQPRRGVEGLRCLPAWPVPVTSLPLPTASTHPGEQKPPHPTGLGVTWVPGSAFAEWGNTKAPQHNLLLPWGSGDGAGALVTPLAPAPHRLRGEEVLDIPGQIRSV